MEKSSLDESWGICVYLWFNKEGISRRSKFHHKTPRSPHHHRETVQHPEFSFVISRPITKSIPFFSAKQGILLESVHISQHVRHSVNHWSFCLKSLNQSFSVCFASPTAPKSMKHRPLTYSTSKHETCVLNAFLGSCTRIARCLSRD